MENLTLKQVETGLVKCIKEQLGLKVVDLDKSLTYLGADSLNTVELVMRLEEEFETEFEFSELDEDNLNSTSIKELVCKLYAYIYGEEPTKEEEKQEMDTKKKIKFPCAVSAEGLDQEQLDKLHAFFLNNGVYNSYSFSEGYCVYVGVDWENETNCFEALEHFSGSHDKDEVTIYTYQELIEDGLEENKEENISPIPEGFIPWYGGEMPVPKGTMVEVKYRDGAPCIVTAGVFPGETDFKRISGARNRHATDWWHNDCRGDIVAYRTYKEESESSCEGTTEVFDQQDSKATDVEENPSKSVVEASETIGKVKLKIVGHSVIQRVGDAWSVEVKDGEVYFYD